MVIIVAFVLSLSFSMLKPFQDANVKNEKYQNILASVGIIVTPQEAEAKYNEVIKESFVFDANGKTYQEKAFDINLEDEFKKLRKDKNYTMKFPVFIANNSGEKLYIFPVRGTGLWGPIWGVLSLKSDLNEVNGIIFDHASETPGLGAEIKDSPEKFKNKFLGKKIFDNSDKFVGIKVVKGSANGDHQVDAISGATITCVGAENMLKDCLGYYKAYIQKLRQQ
jgi:Na+-transporting NADH:ubiquinone oxidoreductase subunit C